MVEAKLLEKNANFFRRVAAKITEKIAGKWLKKIAASRPKLLEKNAGKKNSRFAAKIAGNDFLQFSTRKLLEKKMLEKIFAAKMLEKTAKKNPEKC